MEWIAAMQQAITYMEEHLMEEINYEDVAKHVHTSSYEFHRRVLQRRLRGFMELRRSLPEMNPESLYFLIRL